MTDPEVLASPRPLEETAVTPVPPRVEKDDSDLALDAERWSDLPCTD